jgi:hypothetical protein
MPEGGWFKLQTILEGYLLAKYPKIWLVLKRKEQCLGESSREPSVFCTNLWYAMLTSCGVIVFVISMVILTRG